MCLCAKVFPRAKVTLVQKCLKSPFVQKRRLCKSVPSCKNDTHPQNKVHYKFNLWLVYLILFHQNNYLYFKSSVMMFKVVFCLLH